MKDVVILEERQAPGRAPAGLTWDGQALWVADYAEGTLFALDLQSGEIQNEILCPGVLSGVAWDGTALWQGLIDEGWLRKINPETHDYDRTIVLEDHGRLSGVAWDGNRFWVVSQQRGLLQAVDRELGVVTREIPAPVAGGGLAYRNGILWLSHPDRMRYVDGEFQWEGSQEQYALTAYDVLAGEARASYRIGFLSLGLVWVGDDLWLADHLRRRLVRARLS